MGKWKIVGVVLNRKMQKNVHWNINIYVVTGII